jgi:hypothetical protein
MKFYKTISNFVPFSLTIASRELFFDNMSWGKISPKDITSLPMVYAFIEFLKNGYLVIKKKNKH